MLRVIESGNVCVTGKFLARFQDSKLRVIQDFARVVNVRICEGYCHSHCDRIRLCWSVFRG